MLFRWQSMRLSRGMGLQRIHTGQINSSSHWEAGTLKRLFHLNYLFQSNYWLTSKGGTISTDMTCFLHFPCSMFQSNNSGARLRRWNRNSFLFRTVQSLIGAFKTTDEYPPKISRYSTMRCIQCAFARGARAAPPTLPASEPRACSLSEKAPRASSTKDCILSKLIARLENAT